MQFFTKTLRSKYKSLSMSFITTSVFAKFTNLFQTNLESMTLRRCLIDMKTDLSFQVHF